MDDLFIIRHIKFYNNFYKNIIETELEEFELLHKSFLIEDCCDNKQTEFLVSIIKDYIFTKKINNECVHLNESLCKVSIAAILYYYYHIVLIETHYNEHLQTIHVKSILFEYFNKGKTYHTFIQLTNDLIKGDEPADTRVRKQFIFPNETNVV